MRPGVSAVTSRPAESVGAAGSVAALIAYIAGVNDPATIAYIAAGVGLLPAAVTTLVAHGGIVGVARSIWRGTVKPKEKK